MTLLRLMRRRAPRARLKKGLLPVFWMQAVCSTFLVLPLLRAQAAPAGAKPPEQEKSTQAPAAPATPPKAPEQEKSTQAPAAPAAPAPAPTEGFRWGVWDGHSEVEVGYRWVSDIAGNSDMYRSMINLGDGIKLLRSNLSLRSNYGSSGLFDRLDLVVDSWGGDPYSILRMNLGRSDLYEFRADYRNLNYYNYIPTFSNPLLASGNLLGQHSLNVTNRMVDLELKLFPNGKVRPYAGYSRNSGDGPGFTTYGVTGNEFLLANRRQYTSDDYRGGVELRFTRTSLTLEQGYRFLRNDTGVGFSGDSSGNNERPFLGEDVTLQSLDRAYHERTGMPFSKVLAVFAPVPSLVVTGRYIYSMADAESDFSQIASGNLMSLEDSLLYQTSADSFDTRAKRPSHTTGLIAEFTPFSRLALRDHFDARSYHISGSALLSTDYFRARSLSGSSGPLQDEQVERLEDTFLAYDQRSNLAEVEFDLGRGWIARGGYRYSSVETVLEDSASDGSERGRLIQNAGIAGFSYRHGQRVSLSLDYENAGSDQALMRTDLFDYDQFRFHWRARITNSLSTDGKIAFLRNRNEASEVDLDSHNRNYAFALNYERADRFSLSLDYSRLNLYSNLAILLPHTLDSARSLFDERTHGVGASAGLVFYRGSRLDFGYRAIFSTGSFPLNYHMPSAGLSVPLGERLVWRTGWQYYGYNEKGQSLQDYHGHLLTFSVAHRF